MNWDAIAAVAELLGAIGVIASLFYVASQIRRMTGPGGLQLRIALSRIRSTTAPPSHEPRPSSR